MPHAAADAAETHIRAILSLAIGHGPGRKAVIVSDARSELSSVLAEAYRRCLPGASFLDFDAVSAESVLAAFAPLQAGDLVVLVQSENFRLEAFRIRVELFKRGLKVIEHPHLARMRGPEALRYIESLAYDAVYYRGVGNALKERIDRAQSGSLDSGGATLLFTAPFEPAMLNTGDYAGMRNVGGQYPIGEVFSEARDLETVHGRVRIFAFADIDFMANWPDRPITLVIERGRVAGAEDSTEAFEKVLAGIRADEGEVWVREIGFGMNRAFSREQPVCDIGTLERMCGIHLSLGAKHAVYRKPAFRRKDTRHHVDVFAVTDSMRLDGEVVFCDGAWAV